MERNRSRNRSLFKLSYQTRPSNCGDLSRPLGRLPRFFVDIYVAAVHRSLLRIIERYVTRSSQSFAKRTCPNNSTVRTLRIRVERSSASSCLVHGRTGRKKRRNEERKEEGGTTHFSFPFRRCSSDRVPLKHTRCTLPFVSAADPGHPPHLSFTYTYVHIRTRGEIAGEKSRGRRDGERGGEREGYGKTAPRHRDVARGVSPPTDSRRGSSSFAPSCASTRTGRAGTARRRLVASSARAHASRRARTSPLDCSPARLAAAHLPPRYFPRS